MDRRKILIIVGIIIVVLLLIVCLNKNKKSDTNEVQTTNNKTLNIVETDHLTYRIEKSDGSYVETNTIDEAEWYRDHPDYNPDPMHFEDKNSSSEINNSDDEMFIPQN